MTVSVYADPSGNYATMSIGGSEKFRLNSDGTATLGGVPIHRILSLGTKSTASGTTVDFSPIDSTGIPSWAKKVTINFNGVSTNGPSAVVVYLGDSGGLETAGYSGSVGFVNGSNLCGVALLGLSGINTQYTSASNIRHGSVVLSKYSGDTWSFTGNLSTSEAASSLFLSGNKTLSETLDRIRITTADGTDSFDAGSVSVIVEG